MLIHAYIHIYMPNYIYMYIHTYTDMYLYVCLYTYTIQHTHSHHSHSCKRRYIYSNFIFETNQLLRLLIRH